MCLRTEFESQKQTKNVKTKTNETIVAACGCNPRAREDGGRRIPRLHEPARLAETVSSKFGEGSNLKK